MEITSADQLLCLPDLAIRPGYPTASRWPSLIVEVCLELVPDKRVAQLVIICTNGELHHQTNVRVITHRQ